MHNLTSLWVKNRAFLDENKLTKKAENFIEVLHNNDVVYPHIESNVDLDSVKGSNYREFLKNSRLWIKKLNKYLKDDNKAINDTFSMHLGFLDKHNDELIKYYPMSIEFEDGQILVGLARQYGEAEAQMQLDRKSPIKITKWYLNGENITRAVYSNRQAIQDETLEIKNIASIVNGNHLKFVKNNPELQKTKPKEDLDDTIKELETKRDELIKQRDELKKQIEDMKNKAINEPQNNTSNPRGLTKNDNDAEEKAAELLNKIKEKVKTIEDIDDEVLDWATQIEELYSQDNNIESIYKEFNDYLSNVALGD